MSKKSVLALVLIIVVPVMSYLIVRMVSADAIEMPRRFYADSVVTKIVDGKEKTDTLWHRVANVTLTNQLGNTVSLYDIKDKIIVANFFFTRCPSICPGLTRAMKGLQDGLTINDPRRRINMDFVHFLSFSVDPERDSVPVLKRYADKYGVNHDIWWMMTGPKKTIYDWTLSEIKLPIQDGESVDSNFIHTERFVLMDRDYVIRGYYSGLDTAALSKLAEDMTLLMLERDKKKPRKLF